MIIFPNDIHKSRNDKWKKNKLHYFNILIIICG